MSKTDVYWLQSINCKEGGRMIGGTGPLVLVSSAQWFSVAGEKRRGEMGGEHLTSLIRRKIFKQSRRSKLLSRLTFF